MPLSVAVILCTRNRPERLRDVLVDVRAQGVADEVVVVDQSDVVCAIEGVTHVVDPGRGLPRARNLGIASTTADILVFLDDDTRVLDGCLEAHRRAYDAPEIGGVAGRIVERTLQPNARRVTNRVDWAGRVRTNLESGPRGPIETAKGAHMSFRRTALCAVGGFDEGYAGTAFLEDADLSRRVTVAGWRLVFEPAAAVVHLSEDSGGVRVGDALLTEWWRFHNTGRYVRRHRPLWALGPTCTVFAAIAAKRAVGWRRPRAGARLVGALVRGWWAGAR